MLFSGKRNPLMRQPFKKSNNISNQDVINIVNVFNGKLDQLSTTMSEVRDLLAGGISYPSSNNKQEKKKYTSKNQDFLCSRTGYKFN